MKKRKLVTITIKEEVLDRLDNLSKKDGRSRSNFINCILEKNLGGMKIIK